MCDVFFPIRYSAINEINKSKQEDEETVFVYFITKLPRIEGGTSYVGFHGGDTCFSLFLSRFCVACFIFSFHVHCHTIPVCLLIIQYQ